MFIEALMQAGVYNGLPAKIARKLAVQTVIGAAKTAKASEKHPAELRDSVCTPGGTTIEGVLELEKSAFSGTVMSAVDKSTKKFRQMVNG
jgi:pyrroline-5-carboxylate reductase